MNMIQNLNTINAGACHEKRIFAPTLVSTDHTGHLDGSQKKKKRKGEHSGM